MSAGRRGGLRVNSVGELFLHFWWISVNLFPSARCLAEPKQWLKTRDAAMWRTRRELPYPGAGVVTLCVALSASGSASARTPLTANRTNNHMFICVVNDKNSNFIESSVWSESTFPTTLDRFLNFYGRIKDQVEYNVSRQLFNDGRSWKGQSTLCNRVMSVQEEQETWPLTVRVYCTSEEH